MRSIFIPSHLSLPFLCLFLWLQPLQNHCHGHLSCPVWGGREGGGQQVEHKHTCLPHPLYLPSWGCWAEGPISGPSEPCNQHCQAQIPVEHTGLTLQTVCGDIGQAGRLVGWLAGCWKEAWSMSNSSQSLLGLRMAGRA